MEGEGKCYELALVAYYDAAKKARVEIFTKDIMASLFEDSMIAKISSLKKMMPKIVHQSRATYASANQP